MMKVVTLHQEQSLLRQQLEIERQRVFSLGQVGMTLLHGGTLPLHPFQLVTYIYQEICNSLFLLAMLNISIHIGLLRFNPLDSSNPYNFMTQNLEAHFEDFPNELAG